MTNVPVGLRAVFEKYPYGGRVILWLQGLFYVLRGYTKRSQEYGKKVPLQGNLSLQGPDC
jgi:hypothetical protein